MGEEVLVYNSLLDLFHRNLQSSWGNPFELNKVFPYGELELKKSNGHTFKRNAYLVKAYKEGLQQVHAIVHFSDP